jgi:hypothetical protein
LVDEKRKGVLKKKTIPLIDPEGKPTKKKIQFDIPKQARILKNSPKSSLL